MVDQVERTKLEVLRLFVECAADAKHRGWFNKSEVFEHLTQRGCGLRLAEIAFDQLFPNEIIREYAHGQEPWRYRITFKGFETYDRLKTSLNAV